MNEKPINQTLTAFKQEEGEKYCHQESKELRLKLEEKRKD